METVIYGFDFLTDEDDKECIVSIRITTGKIIDFEKSGRIWFSDENGEKQPVVKEETITITLDSSFNLKSRKEVKKEIISNLIQKGYKIVEIEEINARFNEKK